MVTPLEVAGLGILVGCNTIVAAVGTRVFRAHMATRWGSALYTLFVVPLVLLMITLVLGQVLGPDLGDARTVIGVTVVLPLALGITIDYFWMPAPDEVEVPDTL